MRVEVLGEARAFEAGASVELGARKPRSIVAALAMTPGRAVAADTLADLVWGGEPPRAAHGALHAYLSGLRKVLEPDRGRREAGSVIETTDHGYVLRLPAASVDSHAFATGAEACRRRLSSLESLLRDGATTAWPNRGDVLALLDQLDTTLSTWRGTPYADLPDHPRVTAERAALSRLRAGAEQTRLFALLATGEPEGVLAATESLVAQQDLQERVWGLHALALTRMGRQAEALEALRRVRELLLDQLGLDPGAELRDLEAAILRQDAWLHVTLPRARPPARAAGTPADAADTAGAADAGSAAPGTPAGTPAVAPAPQRRPRATGPSEPDASSSTGAQPDRFLVGRQEERGRVERLLSRAAAGRFGQLQVVGEPGIGKSWLAGVATDVAATHDLQVAVGRCSPDDGAPPLWPWRSVLAQLGHGDGLGDGLAAAVGPDGSGSGQRAFELAEQVRDAVLGAVSRPTLVVIEDLHWADEASLRSLAHIVDTLPESAPLALMLTRRPHPDLAGSGNLAVESLARHHAELVELGGLPAEEAADLVRAVAPAEVPAEVALRWHDRSAGNPYFLVELARLGAAEDGEELPTSIREVVARRLAQLPERALETLRTAAVVGRRFHLLTVAATVGEALGVDDVADDLEVARVAGLVRETGVEEYAFVHALTRDTAESSLSGTRAARRHAQVASTLERRPDVAALHTTEQLVTELARHWSAAGAAHVDRAWRAARAAADQARTLTSYAEAMRLRLAAVEAHRRAPDPDLATRFDLLLELARDAGFAARWPAVEQASIEAIALGRSLGDPRRVAEAARRMTEHCVWTPHELDVLLEDTVDDLRWALAHADPEDWATVGALQLALAVELYNDASSRAERFALVETGMAAAERSGEVGLVPWAASAGWLSNWSPGRRPAREELTRAGLAALEESPDPPHEAVLLLRRAVEACERGDRGAFEADLDAAERLARRIRLHYVTLTAVWLRLTIAAMRDEHDDVATYLAELAVLAPQVAIPMQEAQAPGATVLSVLWRPEQLAATLPLLLVARRAVDGMDTLVHLALARVGDDPEQLRADLRERPERVRDEEYWNTLGDWAMEAEPALVAGDLRLARLAHDTLAPYAGSMVLGGAVAVLGPVDGYLALVRCALGDLAGATRSADAAERSAATWELPAYSRWLRALRDRYGF